MFASYHQSSISLLSVLCVIIDASNAATVPSTSIPELQTVDSVKSNGNGRVIVYNRTKEKVPIDLVCECVPYYLCNSENVIVFSTSHHDNDQNQCQGEIEVCCAIRNETSSSSTSTPAVNTFPSADPQTPKTIIYGKSDDGAIDLRCQCTVFYLCNQQDWVTLPQSNQLQNGCLENDVCCKIEVESGPVTEVDTWPTNATQSKVITYISVEGNERRESRCRCVLFYECLSEDVVELPKTDKIEDQCLQPYVCCKEPTHFR